MVKIKMEIFNRWVMIETIPLTQKTLYDFQNRIPNSFTWRPIVLNQIIKSPSFTIEEWSEVPSGVINNIFLCIEDITGKYIDDKSRLEDLLDQSFEDYSLEEIQGTVKIRDMLIDRIDSIEEDVGVFEYTREDLKILRNKR